MHAPHTKGNEITPRALDWHMTTHQPHSLRCAAMSQVKYKPQLQEKYKQKNGFEFLHQREMDFSSSSSAMSHGTQVAHFVMAVAHAPLTCNSPFLYHMSQLQTSWDLKHPGYNFFSYGRKLFLNGSHLGKSKCAYLHSRRRKGQLTPGKRPACPAVCTWNSPQPLLCDLLPPL